MLFVGRVQLDGVAPHPELAPNEVDVVALVLHVHQAPEDGPLVLFAPAERSSIVLAGVLLGRAQAVDARDRRHHDDVAPGQQGRGRRVAQTVDFVVNGSVFFDIGVPGGYVGLGLVVVVVANEVLDPVIGEELSDLVGELGGQRLVGLEDQRRAVAALSMVQAMVAVLPLPVMPSRVWKRSPCSTPRASASMAWGWSPAGDQLETSLKGGTSDMLPAPCDRQRGPSLGPGPDRPAACSSAEHRYNRCRRWSSSSHGRRGPVTRRAPTARRANGSY